MTAYMIDGEYRPRPWPQLQHVIDPRTGVIADTCHHPLGQALAAAVVEAVTR